MPQWLLVALFVLFAVHLVAFGALALRRRQAYHGLLVLLFLALTLSFGLRLWG